MRAEKPLLAKGAKKRRKKSLDSCFALGYSLFVWRRNRSFRVGDWGWRISR